MLLMTTMFWGTAWPFARRKARPPSTTDAAVGCLEDDLLTGLEAAAPTRSLEHREDGARPKHDRFRHLRFQLFAANHTDAVRHQVIVQRLGFTDKILAVRAPTKHGGRFPVEGRAYSGAV